MSDGLDGLLGGWWTRRSERTCAPTPPASSRSWTCSIHSFVEATSDFDGAKVSALYDSAVAVPYL